MEDIYYKSACTGQIFREYSLRVLDSVYGDGALDLAIQSGLVQRLENPSVIDCLIHGSKVLALTRYREIHKCTLSEADRVVSKIEEDIARQSNKTPLPV